MKCDRCGDEVDYRRTWTAVFTDRQTTERFELCQFCSGVVQAGIDGDHDGDKESDEPPTVGELLEHGSDAIPDDIDSDEAGDEL